MSESPINVPEGTKQWSTRSSSFQTQNCFSNTAWKSHSSAKGIQHPPAGQPHRAFVWEPRQSRDTTKRKGSDRPSPGRKWHVVKDQKRMASPSSGKGAQEAWEHGKEQERKAHWVHFNQATQKACSAQWKRAIQALKFLKSVIIMEHTHTHTLNPRLLRGRQWTNTIHTHTHTHTMLCRQLTSSFIVIYTHHHVQNSQPKGSCRRSMGVSAWASAMTSRGGSWRGACW